MIVSVDRNLDLRMLQIYYYYYYYTNLKRKRQIGRPRPRWKDNIKMDLQEVRCGCMDWIELAQDKDRWLALMNAVVKLRIP